MCCGTLSLVEEQTNFVMWAMFAAPLEIAADIRSIRACASMRGCGRSKTQALVVLPRSAIISSRSISIPCLVVALASLVNIAGNSSAAILLNEEVIRVNQDPLVQQARRVSNDGGINLWKKELVDGSVAVAVLNSTAAAQSNPTHPLGAVVVGSCAPDATTIWELRPIDTLPSDKSASNVVEIVHTASGNLLTVPGCRSTSTPGLGVWLSLEGVANGVLRASI